MRITAITADQLILVGGIPAQIALIGGYHMKNGEWAVHFDTETGMGEIEYIDNRPNRVIGQAEFETHYSWLQEEHSRYLEYVEQQQAQLAQELADNEQALIDSDTFSDGGVSYV